jgi:class 3 adenylate cyclase
MLKEQWAQPRALRRRLGLSLAVVNILGTLIFSGLAYQASRRDTLQSIDDTLCAAAEGVRGIVPDQLPLEAEGAQRTEPSYTENYRRTHASLERYFASTHLSFLYAISVRADDTAFELVSNLSPEQKAAGIDPLTGLLLKPYKPSEGMIAAARTRTRTIDITRDNYGYFRSCLVPVAHAADVNSTVTIFGADMEISDINARLLRGLLTNLGIGAMVLLVTLSVIRLISNRLARDIRIVVNETEAVSRLELAPGDKRRTSAILEVDQLFGALFDMKGGLKAFSKYVPSAVITRVLATGKADIGGERRELSLLMTDVTDFTTISEKLPPERVMSVMSEYFSHVVAPILEAHGTLDKYVGDAIFAYWNAPTRQVDHAALCCRAALKSRAASKTLAEKWATIGEFPWHTRFGLHAGETVFGNVGAPDRMDFTVIGSSVNLASRIEGLNKFYGTEILVSQRLRDLAGDAFSFRSIDYVMPKGAIYAFPIYELLDARENFTAHGMLAQWEAAYSLFAARDWGGALNAFEIFAADHPNDNVARLYVKRCQIFTDAPPTEDWDGVQRFDTK